MNTLTKNRILQDGDEYCTSGTWKPVPAKDFGLQIMFTDYREVRRPSEAPLQNGAGETPIRSRPTPAEVRAHSAEPAVESQPESKSSAPPLPTVISAKAHSTIVPLGRNEKAILFHESATKGKRTIKWIGRNGTYTNRGLSLYRGEGGFNDGVIKVIPIGARGEARNALIEFPVEVIPEVIEFLLRHAPIKGKETK